MIKMFSNLRSQKGFTLVELMATLAILGVIALIAVPIMGNVMNKADDDADDISIILIEEAGRMAYKNGLAFDSVQDETYKVKTLVDNGYLKLKEDDKLNKSGNFVAKQLDDDDFRYNRYSSSPASDFEWDKVGSGVRLLEYTGSDNKVHIPREYDNMPVTKIGEKAFYSLGHINEVSIPDTVTHIGDSAFADNELTSIVLPSELTHIGLAAFGNNNLVKVDLPDGVLDIGVLAFAINDIREVILPDSMEHISGMMFHDNKLTHVDLPSNLRVIDEGAFQNNQLSKLDIPKNVTSIGINSFKNNQLKKVHFEGKLSDESLSDSHMPLFEGNNEDLVISFNKKYEDLEGILVFRLYVDLGLNKGQGYEIKWVD